MEWSRVLLTLLGPFLWKRVASKRVAARRWGVGEHGNEDSQDNQHEQSDQDPLAPRVAEIHGPAQPVAVWDNHSRIVGIDVNEAVPAPIIGAENVARGAPISGCVRLSPGPLRQQKHDEDDQQSADQHEQRRKQRLLPGRAGDHG